MKTMKSIVSTHHLPKTSATIEFDDGYPPMAPTQGNRRLLAMYDKASRDIGAGGVVAVDPSRAGAADVLHARHERADPHLRIDLRARLAEALEDRTRRHTQARVGLVR